MTTKEFLIDMVSSDTGISSKRMAGMIGWLVCIFICLWCTVLTVQAPIIIDVLFYCTAGLLGLDSITGIWKKDASVEVEENIKK